MKTILLLFCVVLSACEGITYPSPARYCEWVDTVGWVIAPSGDTTGVWERRRVAGCENHVEWGRPDRIDVPRPR